MNTYDVAIVGGGAAGLSAALVLARARRTVIVIDAGSPRNGPASHMQGFLTRDGMPPQEFLALARAEVLGYGATIADSPITSITRASSDHFALRTSTGDSYGARRVLVATGLTDLLPTVPGITERWGRDVLHCPYCHGYEVREQRVAVLGGTPEAVQHAQLVRQWADDVVYFPHTSSLTTVERAQLTARAIGIVEGEVTRILTIDDHLSAVEVDGRQHVARDAVFIRPAMEPNAQLLVGLGAATDPKGWVITDDAGQTSIPGVWAAGNSRNPRAQVITAAGEGSASAIAINADLVLEDIAIAMQDFNPTPRA